MATAWDETYDETYESILRVTGDEKYAAKRALAAADGHNWGGEFEPDDD